MFKCRLLKYNLIYKCKAEINLTKWHPVYQTVLVPEVALIEHV